MAVRHIHLVVLASLKNYIYILKVYIYFEVYIYIYPGRCLDCEIRFFAPSKLTFLFASYTRHSCVWYLDRACSTTPGSLSRRGAALHAEIRDSVFEFALTVVVAALVGRPFFDRGDFMGMARAKKLLN